MDLWAFLSRQKDLPKVTKPGSESQLVNVGLVEDQTSKLLLFGHVRGSLDH